MRASRARWLSNAPLDHKRKHREVWKQCRRQKTLSTASCDLPVYPNRWMCTTEQPDVSSVSAENEGKLYVKTEVKAIRCGTVQRPLTPTLSVRVLPPRRGPEEHGGEGTVENFPGCDPAHSRHRIAQVTPSLKPSVPSPLEGEGQDEGKCKDRRRNL